MFDNEKKEDLRKEELKRIRKKYGLQVCEKTQKDKNKFFFYVLEVRFSSKIIFFV